MDGFFLLDIEGTNIGKIKPIVPNVTVKIKRGFRLTLEWDEMLLRYVI